MLKSSLKLKNNYKDKMIFMGQFVMALILMTYSIVNFAEESNGTQDIGEFSSQSIEFNRASAVLSPAHKRAIEGMLLVDDETKNKELTLAVWSDYPLPSQGKELGSDQRTLARMRMVAIKKFVESTSFKGKVRVFNMAEQSNSLAKMFNSTLRDLQSRIAYEKHGDDLHKQKMDVFKVEGKPRKAVLVLANKQTSL